MAKTAKLKKRTSTLHSRASRRAISPTDPSLTKPSSTKPTTTTRTSTSPPPHPASRKPHVLAAHNAGITKKSKSKPLKRAQRLRQLKSMERAADNLEKLELKVAKSVGKERKVRERAKGWEEINGYGGKRKKGFEVLGDELGEDKRREREREWVSDEEMDGGEEGVVQPEVGGEVKQLELVVPESVPLPVAVEDDEYL